MVLFFLITRCFFCSGGMANDGIGISDLFTDDEDWSDYKDWLNDGIRTGGFLSTDLSLSGDED